MDVDPTRDQPGSTQPFGPPLEAGGCGVSLVGDAWLEERVRLVGID